MMNACERRWMRGVAACVLLGVVLVAGLGGCSKSRPEQIRDRATVVERKLEGERDRVLNQQTGATREQMIGHLQELRMALSLVNVSLASVPLLLQSQDQREIGYSVLDEAVGTIDWNIPIYSSGSGGGGGGAAGLARPFPQLFSPQTGLDFTAIRDGRTPPGIAR